MSVYMVAHPSFGPELAAGSGHVSTPCLVHLRRFSDVSRLDFICAAHVQVTLVVIFLLVKSCSLFRCPLAGGLSLDLPALFWH